MSLGGVAVKVGDAAVAVAFACSSFVVCVSWIKILFFVTLPVCGTEREGGGIEVTQTLLPPLLGPSAVPFYSTRTVF